jgi:uncharacterized membrane protein YdjX (TVP38/TMEM64 family)
VVPQPAGQQGATGPATGDDTPVQTADRQHAESAPDEPAPARRKAIVRLSALAFSLVSLGIVFLVGGVIGPAKIQGWVDPLGAWGPVLFIPLSAVLGTILVPGIALAAAAGLLFGPWTGTLCALTAGTLCALLSREVSHRAGNASFDDLATGRVRAIADLAHRRPMTSVVVARLLPGIPDAPISHALGVAGVSAFAVGVGTLFSTIPRSIAYATIGANTNHPTGTASVIGWAVSITTGLVGLVLLWFLYRAWRADRAPIAGEPHAPSDETLSDTVSH